MGLQTETPLRVPQAVVDRGARIALDLWSIHRLQQKLLEVEAGEFLRHRARLRVNELQLVAGELLEGGTRLGAHAEPVNSRWRDHCAVGLDRDLEPALLQRVNERFVELQQGFAAGAHDQPWPVGATWPSLSDRIGEHLGSRELPTTGTTGSPEFGVAEIADGLSAVFLATGPQVASGKAQKDRRSPYVSAFSLEGVVDLPNRIGHRFKSVARGVTRPTTALPRIQGSGKCRSDRAAAASAKPAPASTVRGSRGPRPQPLRSRTAGGDRVF